MPQPNPRYCSPGNLNKRDREHYEVAKSLVGQFDRARFVKQYHKKYPSRKASSIIPSDYCFNRDNKGNIGYPRFLLWDGRSDYLFVGLDGTGWNHAISDIDGAATPKTRSRERAKSKPARGKIGRSRGASPHIRRFLPRPGVSLILDPEVAEAALSAFNTDAYAQRGENRAFEALGNGFQSGKILDQLRRLSGAYRTRAPRPDVSIIATAIENSWEHWCGLLSELPDLAQEVAPMEVTRELLAFFLTQKTSRRPRSLATKALHFAAPRKFIPVDRLAVNKLGAELQAGSWSDTVHFGADEMAVWYRDYMDVIRQIGLRNRDLIVHLLQIDSETGDDPRYAYARGLPKLIDKILWWCGKEGEVTLFQ